ncbi:hypothetical protein MNBD_ALPHA06-416 [hydrothermal vent metagenome]|uniref:Uncharacterized protein n=1 Tax=hydrothermal vent metagenome TaxID=652676 RepID=A0A3B0RCC8_9ZZZZ
MPVPEISFTSPAFRHRLSQGGGRGQALAKALGLSKGRTPDIVDATAGLGKDGFVLAHLGAKITLIERNPSVAAALQQALSQAKIAEPLFAQPAARITLLHGDAMDLLPKLAPPVVYIDPMHPARSKSALVKQPMRDLRQLVGGDSDSAELITIALRHAQKRVVVKWPRHAALPEPILTPSYELAGKTTRYCVFLP